MAHSAFFISGCQSISGSILSDIPESEQRAFDSTCWKFYRFREALGVGET